MARRKVTPERSTLTREAPTAFARRHRTGGEPDEPGDQSDNGPEAKPAEPKAAPEAQLEGKPGEPSKDAPPEPAKPAEPPADAPRISVTKAAPWPDATPQPMKPVDKTALPAGGAADRAQVPAGEAARPRSDTVERARTDTVLMPTLGDVGRPPEMPTMTAPPPLALGSVEDPTHMPGPRDVPAGDVEDPAPPPGRVPPGDSRSLRRDGEFALLYRIATYVITRTGQVGKRGQWRVVEYPTSAAASHSYAKECSRFVSEGFSDYRD